MSRSNCFLCLVIISLLFKQEISNSKEIIYNVSEDLDTIKLGREILDAKIIIKGFGNPLSPVIITGRDSSTTFKGSSTLLIQGVNVIICSIKFMDFFGGDNKGLISVESSNIEGSITLSDIEVECNEAINTLKRYSYVYVNANNVTLEESRFEGKRNLLPMVFIESKFGMGRNCSIKNNIFENTPSVHRNGVEAVLVGTGHVKSNLKCKILGNTFSRYYGDAETVSIKADNTIFERNIFVDCRSGVSIRRGDYCKIYNNTFIRTKTPLRITGSGHEVKHNVFYKSYNVTLTAGNSKSTYIPTTAIKIEENLFIGKGYITIFYPSDSFISPAGIHFCRNVRYGKGVYYVLALPSEFVRPKQGRKKSDIPLLQEPTPANMLPLKIKGIHLAIKNLID